MSEQGTTRADGRTPIEVTLSLSERCANGGRVDLPTNVYLSPQTDEPIIPIYTNSGGFRTGGNISRITISPRFDNIGTLHIDTLEDIQGPDLSPDLYHDDERLSSALSPSVRLCSAPGILVSYI